MTYTIQIPDAAASLLHTLQEAGYEAYVVGGCIRDSILDRPVHDWDISTNATPQEVIAVFGKENTIPTGLQHGTVTVLWPKQRTFFLSCPYRRRSRSKPGQRHFHLHFSGCFSQQHWYPAHVEQRKHHQVYS